MRNSTGQDIDRPHYYSQYWLDVAEGRPTGQSAVSEAAPEAPAAHQATATAEPVETFDEEAPSLAAEVPAPAPAPAPASRKASKQQEKKEPARVTSLSELARIQDLMGRSAEMEDTATPNLEAEPTTEEPELVTDFDLGGAEAPEFAAEDEEEPLLDEEEFDEDEEEDEWGGGGGGGGRKPRKPTKPPRRDRPSRF